LSITSSNTVNSVQLRSLTINWGNTYVIFCIDEVTDKKRPLIDPPYSGY